MSKRTVWIVGKTNPDNYLIWELQGVFEVHDDAVEACIDQFDFFAEVEMNVAFPRESIDFPSICYPLAKNAPR